MPIAVSALPVGEEALRDNEVEIVPGACHSYIEQPPLLLDLLRGAGAEVRRYASIDDVQYENRFPFLAFGGVNGRKDQIILVERRHTSLVAGRIRWIERELGQEPLPRGIPSCDLFQLDQVGTTDRGVLVQPLEMRFVPPTGALKFSRPAGPSCAQVANGLDEPWPVIRGARWRMRVEQRSDRIGRPRH